MSQRKQVALAFALLATIGLVGSVAVFAGVYVAGASTNGRVVDLAVESGTRATCAPVVEYTVDGQPYRGKSQIGTSPCPFAIGEPVTVYYWPQNPGAPALFSFGSLLPIWLCLGLLAVAVSIALRRPKVSERVAETVEADVTKAEDGQLVKIRGTLESAAGAAPLVAPFSGRSCVVCWARLVERTAGEPDRKVQDARIWTDLIVRARSGDARVAATTRLKLGVDADAGGESDHVADPSIAAFLASHAHGKDVSETSAHHYVWYEGLFAAGEEVFVVGYARRAADGSLEIAASGEDLVALEHVAREDRKRAARRFAPPHRA